jgi:hypothetical protein
LSSVLQDNKEYTKSPSEEDAPDIQEDEKETDEEKEEEDNNNENEALT